MHSKSLGRAATALRSANGSLSVRAGEIVGVAAVEGNGQRELLRAVAGLHTCRSAASSEVAQPVGFIPEDRTSEGLIPSLSLTENVVLGLGPEGPWIHGGRIAWREARPAPRELIRDFEITAPGPRCPRRDAERR